MPVTTRVRKSTYRTLLLKKRDELLAFSKAQPEALSASLKTPDEVEFAVQTLQQDVTAMTADLRSQTLREVEGALRRVAGGTYGICESCGEEISPNRLKAVPWTRFCLTCQELQSRN